jgi:hypothetical protein
MNNVIMMAGRHDARLRPDIATGDLRALRRHVETVDRIGAQNLQLEVKQWLASALMRVDYGVYVEDCLHPLRDATEAFCWSIRTLRIDQHAGEIEKRRRWLVDCIMVIEEELRLCPPVAVAI